MAVHFESSFREMLLLMPAFVLLGVPLEAYLWETLSDLLALQAGLTQVLVALPVLTVFVGLLVLVARRLPG